MNAIPAEQKPTPALRSAQLTCMLFGVALIVWGLMPAVIARMVSGEAPSAAVWGQSSATLLVGGAYLALGTLVLRGLGWALWTTLLLSIALLAGAVGYMFFTSSQGSLFALLLPLATASTSVLALEQRRGKAAETAPSR